MTTERDVPTKPAPAPPTPSHGTGPRPRTRPGSTDLTQPMPLVVPSKAPRVVEINPSHDRDPRNR